MPDNTTSAAAAPAATTTPQNNNNNSNSRTSKRFSTLSSTPTFNTTNSAHAEIRDIAVNLDRMENKALASQRVALSEEKSDFLSKLALGAKLDRALNHRMSGQDAVMRPRSVKSMVVSEKMSEKTIVAA